VTIAKLDIEESPTTPSRYGVRGIPTMMLFKGGQMASMKVGAMPKQKILEWLAEAGISAKRRRPPKTTHRGAVGVKLYSARQLPLLRPGPPGDLRQGPGHPDRARRRAA
jgi:hypothetical protein